VLLCEAEESMDNRPECRECGDVYNPLRQKLGYETCTNCGEAEAQTAISRKKKCTAPLFNKGAYQYISSRHDARWIGR